MAKQQPKQPAPPQPKKAKPVSTGFSAFDYLWRNVALVLVFAFVFFLIDRANEGQSKFPELVNEFKQLRQTNQNPLRQQELYDEIMKIQNDTGYFKRLTRGYHWAIHDVAIGGSESVEEYKEKAGKVITLDDKYAMRISSWGLIDYINKNTPPNAVIYLPQSDSIKDNSKWSSVGDPGWMERFLYPRLCVAMGKEKDHPDLMKRITHVVIIEGRGYDKLKYDVPVDQRPQEAVLPIDHPPVPAQNKQ